ncbi:unnamed protein product [Pelagomonas calceolata]|uniref:V-type proton ATPase subunit G n=1 Tax=Pelagomonas calceolata TaxID=35677 RepID=A0A8J2SVJ8_9STRA|nr:unnamed protein product [Pelagomonas calceolata]|mmetsp:Transcript_15988/g.47016  ORF Transcript_15988/g.47016 Transcript_15988/m.47016 type:complete len:122 (+) Transcript_15988:104-469(+)
MTRDGISELMTAENRASKIVTEARAARGERIKEAKREAETVINQIYKGREALFQGSGNKTCCADEFTDMKISTEAEISRMRKDFESSKLCASGMLVKVATAVSLELSETCRLCWQRGKGQR